MLITSRVFALVQLGLARLCYNVPDRGGRALAFILFGVAMFFAVGCLMSAPVF